MAVDSVRLRSSSSIHVILTICCFATAKRFCNSGNYQRSIAREPTITIDDCRSVEDVA
jgi:hypothetical protein